MKKKEVFEYLENHGFKQEEKDGMIGFTTTMKLPGRQIIINGQNMSEPAKDIEVNIEYLGEGCFLNVGEEDNPLFGFKFPDGDNIWVEDAKDLEFWIEAYFNRR